jgi:hypothetical protein
VAGVAGPLKLLWLSHPMLIVDFGSGRGVPFAGMSFGTFVREVYSESPVFCEGFQFCFLGLNTTGTALCSVAGTVRHRLKQCESW